jgi:hypothetical protein
MQLASITASIFCTIAFIHAFAAIEMPALLQSN